ncbi:MAG: hypothetical protein ACI8PZ_004230 [Myxococcota bacterium]|jgi:hypothetical protein
MHAPLLAALFACQNVELAKLETAQELLDDRQRAIAAQTDELRTSMIELGMVARDKPDAQPPGPRSELNDHQLPATPLAGTYPVTLSRTGDPPALPPLPEAERTDTPCGFKFKVEELKPLSDFVLNKLDLGKSSPLLLLEDGKPMPAHAFPKQYEQRCAGAFRHAGFVLLFSPSGTDAGAFGTHEYSLVLSPDVPLRRGDDGRQMYWIYPGTTLTVQFAEGWDETWGEMHVDLAGRVASIAASPLTVTVADEEFEITGEDLVVSTEPDVQQGAWGITLASPPDGPYAIVNLLTVGNAEYARVVTGPRAFNKEAK